MWRLIPLVLLAGCISQRSVTLPDGSQGYSINCSGGRRDVGDCMNRAAELCGRYEIIAQDGYTGPIAANQIGNTTLIANGVKRVLIVKCTH